MDTEPLKLWQAHWKPIAAGTVLAFVLLKVLSKTPKPDGNFPPGPFCLPFIGNLLSLMGGLPHKTLATLAWTKKWPILQLNIAGRPMIVVSTPAYANEVLRKSGNAFASRDTKFTNFAMKMMTTNEKGVPKGVPGNPLSDSFTVTRRVMVKAIGMVKKAFGDRCFNEELDAMFEELEQDGRADGLHVHHMNQTVAECIMNHTLRILYGKRDKELGRQIISLNNSVMKCLGIGKLCMFFPILELFYYKKYSTLMRQTLKTKHDIVDDLLLEREKLRGKEGEPPWFFCDTVLEAERNGEIDRDDVHHLMDEAILAGVETTSTTIEWGLANLVNRPDIVRKLQKEMETNLGKGVDVRADYIDKLPLLKATIKEVFRLHPVVPLMLPHVNPEPAKLDGYDIPKDSLTLINAWLLGRDPKNWKNPDVFNPERFFELPDVDVWGNDGRLIPFGAGKRMCTGIPMALPSVQIFLGRTVQRYDLVLPPGVTKHDMTEYNAGSIRLKHGLHICLKKRLEY